MLLSTMPPYTFQSTLPRRERPAGRLVQRPTAHDFNPRSREGSDDLIQRVCDSWKFQSTLPRRERPRDDLRKVYEIGISIHAPAKGATPKRTRVMWRVLISIHAPAKGATGTILFIEGVSFISIHAPAKGATAKITKTIPDDFRKINNCNNSFAHIYAKHNCKLDIR